MTIFADNRTMAMLIAGDNGRKPAKKSEVLTRAAAAATLRLPRCWWTSRNSWTCRRRTEHVCGRLWPMKLFSVAYRGHEFTVINPSSHVLLRVRLVFFNYAYFQRAGVHVRCTPSQGTEQTACRAFRGLIGIGSRPISRSIFPLVQRPPRKLSDFLASDTAAFNTHWDFNKTGDFKFKLTDLV